MGRVLLGIAALLGFAAVLWMLFDAPGGRTPDAPNRGADAGPGQAPGLAGAGGTVRPEGTPVAPAAVPADVAALVAEATCGDPAREAAAVEALRVRHEQTPFPPAWWLRWALLELPGEQGLMLVATALRALEEHAAFTREHLEAILASTLGAHERRQDLVAALVIALHGGRYGDGAVLEAKHVPVLERIYRHEGSAWGIKRELVYVLDELGADGAPLVPALVDYVRFVLADRVEAAKEAHAAGISVSWDHVEFDVERVLAAFGAAGVPKLLELLEEAYEEEGDGELLGFPPSPVEVLLGALAEAGPEGIAALLALSRDRRARVRLDALQALRDVDSPHDAVREALVARLRDEDAEVRAEAATLLHAHGPASIPALLAVLADDQGAVRRAALASLAALGVDPAVVSEQVLAMLASDDVNAVQTAADTLAGFGAKGAPALPRLLARMDTDDRWLRDRLGEAAARLAPYRPADVEAAWSSGSLHLRRGLVDLLLHVSPVEDGAIDDAWTVGRLRLALDDEDLYVRVRAAAALARSPDRRIVEVLRAGFEARDGGIRTRATEGLGLAGAAGAWALPTMIERLRAERGLWRPGLARGMHGWDEMNVLGTSVAALGRHDNARMLALLGSEPWTLGFAAEQSFSDQGADGLTWLASAWPRASDGAKQAALELAGAALARASAAQAPWREAAHTVIARGLADPAPGVRLEAARAWIHRRPENAAGALPVLVALLGVPDGDVAQDAASLLASLGAHAAPVRAAIEAHRHHPDPRVVAILAPLLETLAEEDDR